MGLAGTDHQHLRAAHGYIELRMFEEANAELEEIDPLCRYLPEVLSARVAIYRNLKKWDLMAAVSRKLLEWNSSDARHFVEWAYAARRAESLHIAHAILTRAEELFPLDGAVQFNLACYEAQMGNISRAKVHLKRATDSDTSLGLLAMTDPDLEPLWSSLSRG